MRLNFNVLWVEDQPENVQAQIDAFKIRMKAEGFEFNPTLCTSLAAVKEKIRDNCFADEIDLILVDWDLGEGAKGQGVIEEIRESIRYKDVVFYSAQALPSALRKIAFDMELEGIFCASREYLIDEVMGVFDSLVKKVLDLDHTRGIVMGATSDIDYIVNDCLLNIYKNADPPGQENLLEKARTLVDKHITDIKKAAVRVKKLIKAEELLKEHNMVLTANDRLRMLGEALKGGPFQDHREKVVAYQQDVVPERNILAHPVMTKKGNARVLIDNQGNEITLERTRELRCKILESRSEFSNLLVLLKRQV